MNIQIDEDVKNYLAQKHAQCITVKTVESKGGCGIPVEPQLEFKVPITLEHFDYFEVDGIDVYIKKGISVNEKLHFKLSNILGLKSINISGISFL